MNDMMKLYRMGGDMPLDQTILLNTASPLITKLAGMLDSGENEKVERIARQLYLLASLSQRQLTADELIAFLGESYSILGEI